MAFRDQKALGMTDELVTFATALLGIQGRRLLVTYGDSARGWRTDTPCAIDSVKAQQTWPLAKWRSDLREQAAKLAGEIMIGCNWHGVPDQFMRDQIGWLFDTPH